MIQPCLVPATIKGVFKKKLRHAEICRLLRKNVAKIEQLRQESRKLHREALDASASLGAWFMEASEEHRELYLKQCDRYGWAASEVLPEEVP